MMARSKSNENVKARKEPATIMNESDQFLQAFEKPTQIYRYLKARFITSPLFLQRNLNYMRGRCTRNNKNRKTYKLNDMLASKTEKIEKEASDKLSSSENLVIAFLRFNDELLNAKYVNIETKLEKISHKRRKEGTMGQNQISIGESRVIVNTDDNGNEIPAVCVDNAQFGRLGDNVQTTFQLTFDVCYTPNSVHTPRKDKDNEEPPSKVPCIRKQYHAELPVFDKLGRNLLLNGLYHVTALENDAYKSSRIACWETFSSESDQNIANWAEEVNKYYFADEDPNPFKTFEKTPKIELYMEWTQKQIPGNNCIQRPKFITDQHNNNSNKENKSINIPAVNGVNGHKHHSEDVKSIEPASKSFIFQFIANSSVKQRNEERVDFICPFCSLNCLRIYSLMKHLKLSHARFLYQYSEENDKGRIDVYINDSYDGSYCGAPHDVLLGSQRGPTRRNVVTYIMVFRPRRPTFSMTEFQELDDGELDQQRTYMSGHNRIYYHSETCIPILPKELDYDSEGEPDPKWLQRTTKQMIDEFTDVNGGEKELMKLWNLHVMKHGFVGDCQIGLACDLFLVEKGQELLEKDLFRNYVVHLNCLFNYGLISPRNLYKNIQKLLNMQKEQVTSATMSTARKAQLECWSVGSGQEQKKTSAPESPLKPIPSTSKATAKNSRETKSTVKPQTSEFDAKAKLKANHKRKLSQTS